MSYMVLAPGGEFVAYVKPGSSPDVTASLRPTGRSTLTATQQESLAESVWLAALDGGWPPWRIFALP